MALSSQHEAERWTFESQVRECFGRCAYAHKTHEKMADDKARSLKAVKWAQIVLSAMTAASAAGVVFGQGTPLATYGTLLLSVLLVILNSYMKDVDPGKDAQRHREAASDIWNVREDYLSLLADTGDVAITLSELRKRRDKLQGSLHKIYRSAPHTDARAYGEAQDALQNREELTFSDAEIDAFLPKPLRRGAENSPVAEPAGVVGVKAGTETVAGLRVRDE